MGVLVVHFFLIILDIICFSWWDALMDVLAASLCYCAIKDEGQYEVSRLLCYVMFMIFDFVFAGVKCCLFFSGVAPSPTGSNKDWRWYAYAVLCAGGTAFYFVGGAIAYKLYKSLKAVFEPGEGGAIVGGPGNDAPAQGGGYFGGYRSVPNNDVEGGGGNSGDGGFKPFQGQGHTLGARSSGSRSSRPTGSTAANASASVNSRQPQRRVPQHVLEKMERRARGEAKE